MLRIAQKVGTRDLSLTGAEHIAAGSMEYDADVYDSDAEYGRWEDEDESNDEDESDDDQASR